MRKLYTESSLEKCIKTASEELGVSEENLKYEIVEEKKSLFRKKITILVETELVETEKSFTRRGRLGKKR